MNCLHVEKTMTGDWLVPEIIFTGFPQLHFFILKWIWGIQRKHSGLQPTSLCVPCMKTNPPLKQKEENFWLSSKYNKIVLTHFQEDQSRYSGRSQALDRTSTGMGTMSDVTGKKTAAMPENFSSSERRISLDISFFFFFFLWHLTPPQLAIRT